MYIKLELDINQVNLVVRALMELPYKHVANIIHAIQISAQEQTKATEAPPAPSAEPPS